MNSGSRNRGFGIIGTGVIAAMHAEAIATLPGARLVAVTDVAAGASAAFAAARGGTAEPDLDTLLARPDIDAVCVCGFPQRLEVTGTDGTVIIEDGQIVRCVLGAGARAGGPGGYGGTAAGAAEAGSDPAAIDVASHAAQIADLLAAIDEGREPAVGGAAGRDTLEIVCAVYESARTGRTVTLRP